MPPKSRFFPGINQTMCHILSILLIDIVMKREPLRGTTEEQNKYDGKRVLLLSLTSVSLNVLVNENTNYFIALYVLQATI